MITDLRTQVYRFLLVREERDSRLAVSVVLTSYRDQSEAEVWARFRRGLTDWTKTPEGDKEWKASGEDFNIGDLSSIPEASYLPSLKNAGILSISIKEFDGEPRSYDEVLIDR